jgi:RNA polymerase sigma factor (sigma-70 family)
VSVPADDADRPARSWTVDAPTFEVLYAQEVDKLFVFLARRVGTTLAEDLTAETFAVAWERRASFDPERAAFSSWLYGIASNLVRRHRRDEHYQLSTYARTGADPVAPSDEVELLDRLASEAAWPQVAAALETMDDLDRDVLTLYAWAGLSYRQIADALDLAIGTVRSRLSRARRRLEERVQLDDLTGPGGRRG